MLSNEKATILLKIFIIATLIIFSYGVIAFVDTIQSEDRLTMSFTGVGEVTIENNIAQISFTYSELGADVSSTREEVHKKANTVYDSLKGAGIKDRDIKTTNYSVRPEYENIRRGDGGVGKRVLKGYRVSHDTVIRIRDLDTVSEILTIITDSDPTRVSGLSFSPDDEERRIIEQRALVLAIKDAKKQAKRVAKESGLRLKKVVGIQEDGYHPVYRRELRAQNVGVSFSAESEKAQDIPIAQGENKVQKMVSITYEVR